MKTLYEHEIPEGSKLYFAATAARKRQIETIAASILVRRGFDEIVTPFFSFHQSVSPELLVRCNDRDNHQVSLRADSTEDAVRIIRKRLKNAQNRWFYVQPVFRYPTSEVNQIGVEVLASSDLAGCLTLAREILSALGVAATLQISNIAIVRAICAELGVEAALFERGEVEQLLVLAAERKLEWLAALVRMQTANDLTRAIKIAPEFLRQPLLDLAALSQAASGANGAVKSAQNENGATTATTKSAQTAQTTNGTGNCGENLATNSAQKCAKFEFDDDFAKNLTQNSTPQNATPAHHAARPALQTPPANIVFSPLYYAKMHYYDQLFFRFLAGNGVLCSGGNYEIDGENAVGFAIFTDEILAQ